MYRLFKRLADVTIIVLLAPIWLPVLGVVAFLVKSFLGSPILFTQKRPGLHNKIFTLYKFRTMLDARGADGVLLPDNVRLTPFGRFLRSTSLDELPELWNVLKGDMSLVGPRPLLSEYLEHYTEEQLRRHDVRPGITGLAQVTGRNGLSWDEQFRLDVIYVDQQSWLLDVQILMKTVIKVLKRDGITATGEATRKKFAGK